jgi:hypothetical protein
MKVQKEIINKKKPTYFSNKDNMYNEKDFENYIGKLYFQQILTVNVKKLKTVLYFCTVP